MNEFSKISGLKVNLNKSELIPLGHSKVEIYTHNFSPGIKITTDKGLGAIRAKIGPTSDVDKIFSKMYSQYVLFRNKYS